jgi:hypothetical protein
MLVNTAAVTDCNFAMEMAIAGFTYARFILLFLNRYQGRLIATQLPVTSLPDGSPVMLLMVSLAGGWPRKLRSRIANWLMQASPMAWSMCVSCVVPVHVFSRACI